MTITLSSVYIKHERRLTLSFSEVLGAGFTDITLYSVTSTDGVGNSPNVIAVVPPISGLQDTDIILDTDLAFGGNYLVTAVGVPGQTSSTPAGTALPFFYGVAPNDTNTETQTIDLDALVFGTDLVWTGADYLESSNGDLATITGIANFQTAMNNRLGSPTILQWDPSWGLQGNDFVNSPSIRATQLRGRLIRQINSDDRTGPGATVTVQQNPKDPTSQIFVCNIPPKGADDVKPIAVQVPIG